MVGKILNFMDIRATGEKDSQEKTRELLIAISYFEPEELAASGLDSVLVTANGSDKIAVVNGDRADKHISELISISNSESPDTIMLPGAFENRKG